MDSQVDWILEQGSVASVKELRAFFLGETTNRELTNKYFPADILDVNFTVSDYFSCIRKQKDLFTPQEAEYLLRRASLFLRLILPPELWVQVHK